MTTTHCDAVMRNGNACGRTNCLIHARGSVDHVCAICLDTTELKYVRSLRCAHKFCRPCISNWLKRQDSCPTCRAEVAPPMRYQLKIEISVLDNQTGQEIHQETHHQNYLPLLAIEIMSNEFEDEIDNFMRVG